MATKKEISILLRMIKNNGDFHLLSKHFKETLEAEKHFCGNTPRYKNMEEFLSFFPIINLIDWYADIISSENGWKRSYNLKSRIYKLWNFYKDIRKYFDINQ